MQKSKREVSQLSQNKNQTLQKSKVKQQTIKRSHEQLETYQNYEYLQEQGFSKCNKKMKSDSRILKKQVSGQSQKERQIRDIAIVSSKIIRMILKKNDDTKCLGQKITQLTVQDFPKKYPIELKNLQIVKEMFTTGVQLPEYYRKQKRIKQALKAGQGKNKTKSLFVFYPTWITTTHVFKYMKKKKFQCLFSGDRGVGKTSSFILYSMLMNNITKYFMSNKEAAIKLIKDKTIRKPEKVFYWSFQQYISKGIIIDQCQQMFNNDVKSKEYQFLLELQKTKNFNILRKNIQDFYEYKSPVNTVIIIDQINALAKLYREHNENRKMNRFRGKQQIQSRQNLYSCNLNRKQISGIAEYKIYNSSVNILKQLISWEDETQPNEEHFEINKDEKLAFPKLDYHLRINQKKAKEQTLYYIIMQYKRYFADFKKPQKKIQKKMKKWNMPPFQASNKKYSKTAQWTSKHNQQFQQLNEDSKQAKLTSFIKIIKDFIKENIFCAIPLLFIRLHLTQVEFSPIEFINGIQDYYYAQKLKLYKRFNKKMLNKQDGTKIAQITFLLSNYILSQKQQSQQIVIKRQQLFNQMKNMFPEMDQKNEIDKYMDQSLFNYSDQKKGYICQIPRRIIERFLRQLTVTYIQQNAQYCLKKLQVNPEQNPVIFGLMAENFITKAMIQCIDHKTQFFLQGTPYKLAAHGKFYQFNQAQGDEIKLEGRMKQMITMAKDNKDQYCLGLPYHKGTQSRSFNSKWVDLCLVKYNLKNQQYQFMFIDLKCGNLIQFKKLNDGANKFRKSLDLSLKSQDINYVLTDVKLHILCKQSQKKRFQKTLYPELKVLNIETLKFKLKPNSQVETASALLQIIKEN